MKKIVVLLALAAPFVAYAQTSGLSITAVGEVSPLTKESVEKLPEPAKTKDTTLPAPAFNYTLQTKRYLTTVQIDTIKAPKLGAEPVQKLYRTYARAGVGNNGLLLGEFYFGSLRSKTGAYGVHLSHFSAGGGVKDVAGEETGFTQQDVNIFGKKFLKKHTLYGGLDFDRDVVYNYGSVSPSNTFDAGSTRQHFNYYSANARLQSHLTDSASINHLVGLRYYHLTDRYDIREDNIQLKATGSRFIRTEKIELTLGVDYNHNAGPSDTTFGTIVQVQPLFSKHGDKINIEFGGGMYIDASEEVAAYFHERFYVSYDFVNHILVPYLSLTGSYERNSMRTLTLANPFLLTSESFKLKNTQRKHELTIGLHGSISSEIAYDVHVSRYELIDAPFFVNTNFTQDIFMNKFAVVYDNAIVQNIHGQIGWQKFEKIRVVGTGDWYHYAMAAEQHPWHTPTLRLSVLGQYNLEDRLLANLEVYYINGQYAKVPNGSAYTAVTLKGLVDINLGFEYRYTKFLSLFLNLNNIGAQRYQRWYGYPTQGFNLLGGLTYTF
jgi:hypothetical protein